MTSVLVRNEDQPRIRPTLALTKDRWVVSMLGFHCVSPVLIYRSCSHASLCRACVAYIMYICCTMHDYNDHRPQPWS